MKSTKLNKVIFLFVNWSVFPPLHHLRLQCFTCMTASYSPSIPHDAIEPFSSPMLEWGLLSTQNQHLTSDLIPRSAKLCDKTSRPSCKIFIIRSFCLMAYATARPNLDWLATTNDSHQLKKASSLGFKRLRRKSYRSSMDNSDIRKSVNYSGLLY